MAAPIDFRPSRIKVQGANSDIDRLRQLTSPLDRSFYECVVEKKRPVIYKNPPTFYELTYRPKEPIPERLANIIGHVCGDLRSALDYLAKRIGIARIPGFDPEKPFYFPTAPRKDLPAHSSLAPIEQALPGFKKLLLDEIRPENGPSDHFWSFAALSNDGKHNDFVPVVTMVRIANINATIGGSRMSNCSFRGDAAKPINIARTDGAPITIENNFQTTVEVKFGKGTAFENEPVVPTLLQISEVVTKAIDSIEALALA